MGHRYEIRVAAITCLGLANVLLSGCGGSRAVPGIANSNVSVTSKSPTGTTTTTTTSSTTTGGVNQPTGINPNSTTPPTGTTPDPNTTPAVPVSTVSGDYKFLGRMEPGQADPNAPQLMTWPDSTIIANFTGSTTVAPTFTDVEGPNVFDLSVDGGTVQTWDASITATPTITGLDASAHHTVTLIKRTETFLGWSTFTGFALETGGVILPPPVAQARRIEIIGDSISCGYGVLGTEIDCPNVTPYEDATLAYGPLTAAALNADVAVVAYSGKGMYRNNDGTTTQTMPELWLQDSAIDPNTPWNVSYFTPQVVVVALGTNDFTFGAPPPDDTIFTNTYEQFLATLRTAYPDAQIIAAVGPMLTDTALASCLADTQAAVTSRQNGGDPNVHLMQWATLDPNTGEGCQNHPNIGSQAAMSTALVAEIHSLLGW